MSFCAITIQGNLGRDPETKYLNDGQAICTFSVAVGRKVKGVDQTTWFRCVSFGKTAEIAGKYLKKGSNALVHGSIASREYTNNDGIKQTAWEVNVNQLTLLGNKNDADSSNAGSSSSGSQSDSLSVGTSKPATASQNKRPSSNFDDFDDDIPF